MSASISFLVKSFSGNFYRHLAIFIWSHCQEYPRTLTPASRMQVSNKLFYNCKGKKLGLRKGFIPTLTKKSVVDGCTIRCKLMPNVLPMVISLAIFTSNHCISGVCPWVLLFYMCYFSLNSPWAFAKLHVHVSS